MNESLDLIGLKRRGLKIFCCTLRGFERNEIGAQAFSREVRGQLGKLDNG